MLKIKDNVDLKELEKYGFTKPKYGCYEKLVKDNWNYKMYIYITKDTRKIQVNTYDDYDVDLDDTLYDLIQAGLVEKVDE